MDMNIRVGRLRRRVETSDWAVKTKVLQGTLEEEWREGEKQHFFYLGFPLPAGAVARDVRSHAAGATCAADCVGQALGVDTDGQIWLAHLKCPCQTAALQDSDHVGRFCVFF